MRYYSVIIPVYNRPDELHELLGCLTQQSYKNFEVIVVEDGSKTKADKVVEQYRNNLDLHYFFQDNTGQGFARNFGFSQAKGDYFVIFDSDILLNSDYLATVEHFLESHYVDLYGGPDTDHTTFTPIQRAISYSMTSVFTTGGIRGKSNNLGGTFHPRSFNMGMSRKAWERSGGFAKRDMGEDMELSTRLMNMGFASALIEAASVCHKRRGSFLDFFRQVFSFGRTRIQLKRSYKIPIKLVHLLPVAFTLATLSLPFLALLSMPLFTLGLGLLALYSFCIFFDSLLRNKNLIIALLSIISAFIQLLGYGLGFLRELLRQ